MTLLVLAVVAGAGLAGGVVLAVGAMTGVVEAGPFADSRIVRWVVWIWCGPHRSAAARTAHQRRLVAAGVLVLLVWLVTGMPVVAALVGLAVAGLPWLLGAGKLEEAAIGRLEAVESWTRRLKDIVDTGTGLQQAIVTSVATAPTDIADEVRDLAARLQAGQDATDALYRFADDLDDQHADEVIAALIQHLTVRGARLGDVLAGIADAAAEQVATRRAVHAERANSRLTLNVLTGMVCAEFVIGALVPDYARPYATGVGQVILLGASAAFIALLLLARSVSLPRRPARFLTRPTAAAQDPATAPELAAGGT